MENASKALIIAGSILVSILVISLGVVIFRNMSANVNQQSRLTEQEISNFNSRFTKYLGENVIGYDVNALLQIVRQVNMQEDIVGDAEIKINLKDTTSTKSGVIPGGADTSKDTIRRVENSNSYYKVEIPTNGYRDGLINTINIEVKP